MGIAIISGYERAYYQGLDIFVVIGGDEQMDLNDLPELLNPIKNNEADYVKGNRFIYKNPISKGNTFREMPRIRLFKNIIISYLTKIVSGYKNISDSQMGYTAMHRDVFSSINWSKARKGYGYPDDWLTRFHIARVRVKDIPVRPIYLKNEKQTKIKVRTFMI